LTASLHGKVRVIEILHIGHRRGPPSEAQALYLDRQLSESDESHDD